MTKISGYGALTALSYSDLLPLVDVSDTTMAASGTTKKVTAAALRGILMPSGVDDTTAINTAMAAGMGPVLLGPGTFTAHLSPTSFTRILGMGAGITTLQNTAGQPLFSMDTVAAGKIDMFELAYMTVNVTGADMFYGANIVRSSVHHCWLIQNSTANAIWNCSATTGQGTTYMAECEFFANREYVLGTPRTIEAWHLDMQGPNNANDNSWRRSTLYNQGHDTAMYHYRMIGNAGSSAASRANEWFKLCFEYPTGGMIRLEGVTDATIDRCTNEDLAALTVTTNPLISLGVSAGGAACSNIKIDGYMRRGGSNVTTDIGADSSAVNGIDIVNATQDAGGAALAINLNGATSQSVRGIGGSGVSNLGSTAGTSTRSLAADGLTGSAQTLATGNTITIANPVNRVSNSGAVTGIILTPGIVGGQEVCVLNQGTGSVTMAASGTSNVANGTGCVIAANTGLTFRWNSGQSLWYQV